MKTEVSSNPRILVIGSFPPPGSKIIGGLVTNCKALMESSFPRRFDVQVIDSTMISLPPPGFFVRLWHAARRTLVFFHRLYKVRPDAVLLFASGGGSLVEKGMMAWIARISGVPALMFPVHGDVMDKYDASPFARIWIRYAFGGARKFLCQGPAWQRFATESLWFSKQDAPIVPNWAAPERLLMIGGGRDNPPSASPKLLFLGWITREKGVLDLLEACLRLAPDHAFSLTLVGNGSAEQEARMFVEKNGLSERVCFHGLVQGKELEAVLREADVLVLPSWREGLPNAMIEAMAAGLAVIVSAVGNVPDIVTDGREAILVPPKDVDRLENALKRLIEDGKLREELAQRGHAFAAENFSVEPAVEKLELAILDVID